MIRTYSDELIVLETRKETVQGIPHLVAICESDSKSDPREVEIHFYGKVAGEAAKRLFKGMRFAYRGFVRIRSGEPPQLVAKTICPIA